MSVEGFYYDPKHGNCLRRILRSGLNTYTIQGVYGDDEKGATGTPWTAIMTETRPGIFSIDFSGKPTKRTRVMTARLVERRLRWSDGNEWRSLYYNARQLH